jgi:hypothetical protein
MTRDTAFERYFLARAELAEDLWSKEWRLEASILITTSLDALGAIWMHDFPSDRKALEKEVGGKPPSSIVMTRLLRRFAPSDPDALKVAVVCFAEDWTRHVPASAVDADALLTDRLGRFKGELPHSHRDVTRDALLLEAPAIATNTKLAALVEEYEYPALLYRFYRCPVVHMGSSARRTHGFTRGTEVMYMPLHKGFTSISFGPHLMTRWLRSAVTGYVDACDAANVKPAADLDPGQREEETLANRWAKVS